MVRKTSCFRRILADAKGICFRDHKPCPAKDTSNYSETAANQAVRIPVEFELPGDEAIMHRDGDRLVIEPVRKRVILALLKTISKVIRQASLALNRTSGFYLEDNNDCRER